ncbi:MAG: HEAT repeat domain-containing protein [Elusimicrobiota bacterium]
MNRVTLTFALFILYSGSTGLAGNPAGKKKPQEVMPVVHNGVEYSCDHSQPGYVNAADAQTGEKKWIKKVYDAGTEKSGLIFITSLSILDSKLVVKDEAGRTYRVDLEEPVQKDITGPYKRYKDDSQMPALMEKLMLEVKENRRVTVNYNDMVRSFGFKLFPYLNGYAKNKSEYVRWMACEMLNGLAQFKEIREEERIRVIAVLAELAGDSSGSVSLHVSESLKFFRKADFSEESIKVLKRHLDKAVTSGAVGRNIMLACGAAGMKDRADFLKKLLIDEKAQASSVKGKWYNTYGWAARLALARMGEPEEITHCIEMIETETDLQILVFNMFPYLSYMRQPAAVDVLKKYLEGSVTGTVHGFYLKKYAAYRLSEMIEGFPAKTRMEEYTEEKIKICRDWFDNNKEYKLIR